MTSRHVVFTVALALLVGNTHATDVISTGQARALSPAVAKILLQRAVTTTLLHDCGVHFPKLASAAGQATTNWLQANRKVLSKVDSLREHLLQSLQKQRSTFAAEKYALDIDQAMKQSVQDVEHSLNTYPPRQQHALCNHLILSVNAGEWDVQHKQAEAFAIVQRYH